MIGVDPGGEQTWRSYLRSVLVFSLIVGDSPSGRAHKRLVEPGIASSIYADSLAMAELALEIEQRLKIRLDDEVLSRWGPGDSTGPALLPPF